MIRRTLMLILLLAAVSTVAVARPDNSTDFRRAVQGSTPWLRDSAPSLDKAAVDTFYILGGPDSFVGKFENATGVADWNGWTHQDLNVSQENHWHVSSYWAAGLNGHGPGNQALVCVDEAIPACDAPDTVGGVGDNWMDDVQWTGTVSDPLNPVTVRLTAFMHYDLADIDWDFLELHIYRGEITEMLGQWTGTDYDVALDISTVLQPADLVGPGADEVRIFWRVWSDLGYNDLDCFSPSHGAAQIDDISIYFNDELISFNDFEPGSPMDWTLKDFTGVGDFAKLRGNLPDLDPCRGNNSIQVTFIDDGLVVPGTGGTYCETHCYGLGGFILNNTGGLLADDPNRDWFLKNAIYSPPAAWIPGAEAAELAFDVYRHELFSPAGPGIFYDWGVRSTASTNPADLEFAPWKSRGLAYMGGPDYKRQIEPVGDLILPDARWVQIKIEVTELGWLWNLNGTDGTPAPYFDNVALKAWAASGPEILVAEWRNFVDSFPEQGLLDPVDLASNWCRLDTSVDLDRWGHEFIAADSLLVEIVPQRFDAVLVDMPQMHWVMDCNPAFDLVRPTTPGGDGILRGHVLASNVPNGSIPSETLFAFDLPDTGWFFPGDRVRYYITTEDDVSGDVMMSVWPADTTGILDFSPASTYPGYAEARALPTLAVPSPGLFIQPELLFSDDGGSQDNTDRMLRSLAELGFVRGVDFDHFRTRTENSSALSGMGASGTATSLAGYQTMIYDSGTSERPTLSGASDSHEEELFEAWLDFGDKRALLMGDGLFTGMKWNAPSLLSRLGVIRDTDDLSLVNGGYRDLRINPAPGNGILPDDSTWMVNALCPLTRKVDGLFTETASVTIASLDPVGPDRGQYAAAIAQTDTILGNKIGMLPFSFPPVTTAPENPVLGEPNFSARTLLLKHFLDWFAVTGSGPYSPVPDVRALAFQVGPNPFNPLTTIEFDLPRSAAVTLDIYDIQGRRVKQLLNEAMAAGPHSQAWRGQDGQGRQVPSGIYFYRFTAGDQERRGKLTLLK